MCPFGWLLLIWVQHVAYAWNIAADKCDEVISGDVVSLEGCEVSLDQENYMYATCETYFQITLDTNSLGSRTDTVIMSWGLRSDVPLENLNENICLHFINLTLWKDDDSRPKKGALRFNISKEIESEYSEVRRFRMFYVSHNPKIIAFANFTSRYDCKPSFLRMHVNRSCKVHIHAYRKMALADNWLSEVHHSPHYNHNISWFDLYFREHTVSFYQIELRPGFKNLSCVLMFIDRFNVTSLEISKNGYRGIKDGDFPGFPELRKIAFNEGAISTIGRNAFCKLPKLISVNLRRNGLTALSPALCKSCVPNLLELNVEGNRLGETDAFVNCSLSVSVLRLSKNPIGGIDKTILSFFPRVTELYLDECNISDVPEGAFRNLTFLVHLDLSLNNLSFLPTTFFHSLQNLEILSLSGNKLKSIIPFHLSPRLNYLDISWNKISVLPKHEQQQFQRKIRAKINLKGNPFDCSPCKLEAFFSVFNQFDLINHKSYLCHSPVELSDKIIFQLDSSYRECPDETVNVTVSAIVIPVICSLLLFSVFIYFRWNIYFIVYKYKRKILPPSISSGDCYKYDCFVAYAAPERTWVVNELLPRMEYTKDGLTLCVHDRDFVAGEWITENIINCVNSSRKIMLLLSQNFVKSQWCMFEMHLVQSKLFVKKRSCVILVKMDNLSDCHLSAYLSYLMNTRTYLEWPDVEEDRSLFWKRLSHVLRKNSASEQQNDNSV